MHIQSYGSTEEMVEAMRANAAAAHAGLHPAQQALTFGDHWVQFHDLANRHVIFGRISTSEEVAIEEIAAGAGLSEAVASASDAAARLDRGYMYGMAYDKFDLVGELGTTHKAHVWPIEERLFGMARGADWDIDHLNEVGRLLLNIAFLAHRAHVRSLVQ